MAITKKEYSVIKEVILAHSTYTWCNGHCVPMADTNAVLQSLDNIFADELHIEREAIREYKKPITEYTSETPKEENIKKKRWKSR